MYIYGEREREGEGESEREGGSDVQSAENYTVF